MPAPRCVLVLILMLAGAAGCARDEHADAPPEEAPGVPVATHQVGGEPPATVAVPPAPAGSTAPAAAPVGALAGGDPQEASCLESMMAGVTPGTGLEARPDAAMVAAAGTAAQQCLPPAKLAAALADRVASASLGLGLSPDQVDCVRATLVGSGGAPGFTELVGGLAMGDATAVREAAGSIDAACGTQLAALAGE